jgi:hypothetical protein
LYATLYISCCLEVYNAGKESMPRSIVSTGMAQGLIGR